jgi:AcrR family transcriptional regulator
MTNFKSKARRRGNSADTRARILAAARLQFTGHTYEAVGLRNIARVAKADVALVARYFGSKEGLYWAVMCEFMKAHDLTAGDRATFGKRMASWLLGNDSSELLEALFFSLRAMTSARTLTLLRKSEHQFSDRFARWLGGSRRQLRAHLIGSTMFGVTVSRVVNGELFSSKAAQADYARHIANLLQAYVDDRWISGGAQVPESRAGRTGRARRAEPAKP